MYFHSQLLDYGIALKLDRLRFAMPRLVRLLHLMIMLSEGRSNSYIQSVLMHTMIQMHQSQYELPHYKMLKTSLSMTNEEPGEITFSVLSRCCLGDTTKKKIGHVSDMYRNIHNVRSLDDELRRSVDGSNHGRKNWRRRFPPEDETVCAVRAFLKGRIRAIKANQAQKYDGNATGYINSTSAAKHQVPYEHATCRWLDKAHTEQALDLHIMKCKKFVDTTWGYERSEVLTSMAPNGGKDFEPLPAHLFDCSADESSEDYTDLTVRVPPAQVPCQKASKRAVPPKRNIKNKRKKPLGQDRAVQAEAKVDTPEGGSPTSLGSLGSNSDGSKEPTSPAAWQNLSWSNVGNVDQSLILDTSKKRNRKKTRIFRAGDASTSAATDWTSAVDSDGGIIRLSRQGPYRNRRPGYGRG
jgi:hypothetical protein